MGGDAVGLFAEIGFDIIEAFFDRDEWIAGASILFDDEPTATGGFCGCDDAFEV